MRTNDVQAARVPRAAARARGGAPAAPSAHVRVIGARLDPSQRDAIKQKLGRSLSAFSSSIVRISLRLSDVNGPKRGVDHRCVVKVVLRGLPSVVVERTDASAPRAIAASISAARQTVRRTVQRRRLKPLNRRASRPASAT